MKKKIVVCLLFLFFTASCSNKNAGNELFKNATLSIVELKCNKDNYESYGTAVYIGDNQYLTNCHVVTYMDMNECKEFDNFFIRTAYEETYHKVSLLFYDESKDLAILESYEMVSYKKIEFAKVNDILTGMDVFAIGNTQNQGLSISKGLISNARIQITYSNKTMDVIATDAYISEGNSGGALIDVNGKLIGITTLRMKDNLGNIIYGMGYSIPIDIIDDFIKSSIDETVNCSN